MNVLAFRRTTQGFTSLFEKLETLITERLKVVTPEDFVLEVIDALQDVLSKSTSMELWGAAGLVDNIVNQFTKKGKFPPNRASRTHGTKHHVVKDYRFHCAERLGRPHSIKLAASFIANSCKIASTSTTTWTCLYPRMKSSPTACRS